MLRSTQAVFITYVLMIGVFQVGSAYYVFMRYVFQVVLFFRYIDAVKISKIPLNVKLLVKVQSRERERIMQVGGYNLKLKDIRSESNFWVGVFFQRMDVPYEREDVHACVRALFLFVLLMYLSLCISIYLHSSLSL